jgi:hypothetical protein
LLVVADKLQNTVKERPAVAIPIIASPRSVEAAEETLSFSPRGGAEPAPKATTAATPRSAVASTPRSSEGIREEKLPYDIT